MSHHQVPLWWIDGIVDHVDLKQNTISVWMCSEFEGLQTVPLMETIPQWMRFSDVYFSTHLPCSCLEAEKLEGVVWGTFLCHGMEFQTESEVAWQMGFINPRVAERSCHKGLTDGPAHTCAVALWGFIGELLKQHQSDGWPMVSNTCPVELGRVVQDLRKMFAQAFQTIHSEYVVLQPLCENVLCSLAPENEDDFTCATVQQRFHTWISDLLDCEAKSVVLARLLMEIYPSRAASLQTMIRTYHQHAPSPIADIVDAK